MVRAGGNPGEREKQGKQGRFDIKQTRRELLVRPSKEGGKERDNFCRKCEESGHTKMMCPLWESRKVSQGDPSQRTSQGWLLGNSTDSEGTHLQELAASNTL